MFIIKFDDKFRNEKSNKILIIAPTLDIFFGRTSRAILAFVGKTKSRAKYQGGFFKTIVHI